MESRRALEALGALVFHERPPVIAYFGMTLVIVGGLAITFARAALVPHEPEAGQRGRATL